MATNISITKFISWYTIYIIINKNRFEILTHIIPISCHMKDQIKCVSPGPCTYCFHLVHGFYKMVSTHRIRKLWKYKQRYLFFWNAPSVHPNKLSSLWGSRTRVADNLLKLFWFTLGSLSQEWKGKSTVWSFLRGSVGREMDYVGALHSQSCRWDWRIRNLFKKHNKALKPMHVNSHGHSGRAAHPVRTAAWYGFKNAFPLTNGIWAHY